MKKTRDFNQITQDFTIDQYLHQLVGFDIEEDSLLHHAGEMVWHITTKDSMPSSLDVALLLSELGADETTLIVTLLSSTQLMEQADAKKMERIFGRDIMQLVNNVIQLHEFHGERDDSSPEQVERLRRMLLSMVNDIRAVLIKLAFRVQRLRQLKLAPQNEQQEIAQESLDIFAPIANRLGIGQLKWELEDLAFRYLEPENYKRIAKSLDGKIEEREQFIADVVDTIKQIAIEDGIAAEIYGRPKHIYSIWRKMVGKQRGFDELFDVRAVRVVVSNIAECYTVLGLVHAQWRHINKEFDDYIANPKENGYQSLHTAVYGPHGKPIEIQIRTEQMHEFSEFGVAAHWRYKEMGGNKNNLQSGIESLRKLLDNTQGNDKELMESFRSELFHNRVYVLTPEGRVIDLPEGGTPLDFAYAVHTEIGHRCRGAKVNGCIVQLTYQLKNGERVEILTAKEAAPRRDWMISHLDFIKTSRARSRIRSWFRKQDKSKNHLEGKALCEREFKRYGIKPDITKVVKHFKLDSIENFYINLGRGDISIAQMSAMLHEFDEGKKNKGSIPIKAALRYKTLKKSNNNVNVLGVGNLLTGIANCCMPVPHDDIIGFITKDRGVSVHRIDCNNILHLKEKEQTRLIEVEWGNTNEQSYPVNILIQANDRHGLLSDITSTLSDDKVNVLAVNTASNKKEQTAKMAVTIEIRDLQQLTRIMDKVTQLRNVLEVSRGANGDTLAL
ncbi:Inactive (p)ppGpp 3'-pyrophosphohydrolase domain / GTP pyrophosphokinase, (p)ppGpp synthetase I [hydrothermal vent metagenome]|uniref:Inactive (P)ppGpp 3'-pyrophosphohydrolase domain / GTP pyrophosphokinase, (P)ppGpp synthetase I n=1 Tax=hydrothermal vent metagenome TaxID=652676 RepID=A0A3B0WHY5_9ZZZZ